MYSCVSTPRTSGVSLRMSALCEQTSLTMCGIGMKLFCGSWSRLGGNHQSLQTQPRRRYGMLGQRCLTRSFMRRRRPRRHKPNSLPDQWPVSHLGFNRSMQHSRDCVGRRSVPDEAKTEDLLHGKPESLDVGALAKRGVSSADRPVV